MASISASFVRIFSLFDLHLLKCSCWTVPQFAYLLSETSTASSVTTSVNQAAESCTPTGTTALVESLIIAAVQGLSTNLSIQSTVKLDNFETPLTFVQNNVPTQLADSVVYLTGLIGKTCKLETSS